jgi:hypothetical protein
VGVLSNAMTELCSEIVAMRQQRKALANRLKEEHRTRRAAVKERCNDLASARVRMATEVKRQHQSFRRKREQLTHQLRQDMRSDLAGARRGWAGKVA